MVNLGNVPSDRTLLELLREDMGLTGTQEGCGEGDCGACTVVLGQVEDGALRFRAINSCIRLAHSIDGMALWTVEDLAASDGRLHPAQEAMVNATRRNATFARQALSWACSACTRTIWPLRLPLRVLRCPPGGRCACGPAKPVPRHRLVEREKTPPRLSRFSPSRGRWRRKRFRATCAGAPATGRFWIPRSTGRVCRRPLSIRPNCYRNWSCLRTPVVRKRPIWLINCRQRWLNCSGFALRTRKHSLSRAAPMWGCG